MHLLTHLIELLQEGQSSITGPEEAGHTLLLSFWQTDPRYCRNRLVVQRQSWNTTYYEKWMISELLSWAATSTECTRRRNRAQTSTLNVANNSRFASDHWWTVEDIIFGQWHCKFASAHQHVLEIIVILIKLIYWEGITLVLLASNFCTGIIKDIFV